MSKPVTLIPILALATLAGCGAARILSPAASTTRIAPNYLDTLGRTARWPTRTVSVRLDGPPSLGDAFAQAARLWSERTDGAVAFAAVDAPSAQIRISVATPAELGAGVAGDTEQLLSGATLLRVGIRVDANLTGEDLVQALAHELGHALGVNGHSPDPADLMYYRAHLPAEVTLRDSNTVRSIYGDTGRAAPVESDAAVVRIRACTLPTP